MSVHFGKDAIEKLKTSTIEARIDAIEALMVATFEARLKEALGDYTITEFAEKMGLSKQIISAYTTGKRTPKNVTLHAIADALNVNTSWLLGYDVPKEKGVFDTFVRAKDIPEYIMNHINSEAELIYFLEEMFTKEEIHLLLDFKKLNDSGKDYILKTMELALLNYLDKEGGEQ